MLKTHKFQTYHWKAYQNLVSNNTLVSFESCKTYAQQGQTEPQE